MVVRVNLSIHCPWCEDIFPIIFKKILEGSNIITFEDFDITEPSFFFMKDRLWVESFTTPNQIEKLITFMEKNPNVLLKIYKKQKHYGEL